MQTKKELCSRHSMCEPGARQPLALFAVHPAKLQVNKEKSSEVSWWLCDIDEGETPL